MRIEKLRIKKRKWILSNFIKIYFDNKFLGEIIYALENTLNTLLIFTLIY